MSFWTQRSVLVTGGHGFVGSHLIDKLSHEGCTKIFAPKSTEVDLRDERAVRTLFSEKKFDFVFHLAASVGGIGANRDRPADFFRDNELMGVHVIHESAMAKVEKLVILGTICAYPKFCPVPFLETSLWDGYPEETNAPYGVAKRSLMTCADAYADQYGLSYVGVFPTNLYGPRDDFDLQTSHVIPAMIRKCEEARLSNRESVTLWGSGSPTRDFLFVKDAVSGILAAAQSPKSNRNIYNLGSDREVMISELASWIAEVTGFKGSFVWDASKPDGQPRRRVSNEKAKKDFGFQPQYDLERGLQETIAWFRENFQS